MLTVVVAKRRIYLVDSRGITVRSYPNDEIMFRHVCELAALAQVWTDQDPSWMPYLRRVLDRSSPLLPDPD